MSNSKNSKEFYPTNALPEKFNMLLPMLDSALKEMREFSKKKQDGILNPLKVKLINRLLNDIKSVLESEASVQYLEILDEDALPQNSDVVLILGQYSAAMEHFRNKFYKGDTTVNKINSLTHEQMAKLMSITDFKEFKEYLENL